MASVVDYKNLKAGDEVNAWCTKCHEMRLHKVKAVDPKGEKAPRVICMCPKQTERNFRPNPPKSHQKKRATKRVADGSNPWEDMSKEQDTSNARSYTIHDHFVIGEIIDHRRYGIGFVLDAVDATKIIVAFEDKKRVMICNQ